MKQDDDKYAKNVRYRTKNSLFDKRTWDTDTCTRAYQQEKYRNKRVNIEKQNDEREREKKRWYFYIDLRSRYFYSLRQTLQLLVCSQMTKGEKGSEPLRTEQILL